MRDVCSVIILLGKRVSRGSETDVPPREKSEHMMITSHTYFVNRKRMRSWREAEINRLTIESWKFIFRDRIRMYVFFTRNRHDSSLYYFFSITRNEKSIRYQFTGLHCINRIVFIVRFFINQFPIFLIDRIIIKYNVSFLFI